MKSKILTLALVIFVSTTFAQTQECDTCFNLKPDCDNTEELKVMYINKNVSTHFIAMEDITYVDISNNSIVGDIPVNNIVRIKPVEEGADGIITIVTESYFVQYMMVYTDDLSKVYTKHNIQYSELTSLMNPERTMTKSDLIDYASKMYNQNKHYYDVSLCDDFFRNKLGRSGGSNLEGRVRRFEHSWNVGQHDELSCLPLHGYSRRQVAHSHRL